MSGKLTIEQLPGLVAENHAQTLQQFDALRAEIQQLAERLGTQPEPEQLLTREETATFLKISLPTLDNWTDEGLVNAYRMGGRKYYKRNEIINALKPVNTSIKPFGKRKAA